MKEPFGPAARVCLTSLSRLAASLCDIAKDLRSKGN